MNRRKFLQLSAIAPVATLSCKQQKVPVVSKPNRDADDSIRWDNVNEVWRDDKMLPPGEYTVTPTTVKMKVTAYCACKKCCGKYADGVTASGHFIYLGDKFVAADKRYPFGTVMYVPEYCDEITHPYSCYRQTVAVIDRGGAIKGNHIDVYFDTHQEALDWGVRYLDVIVYGLKDRKE